MGIANISQPFPWFAACSEFQWAMASHRIECGRTSMDRHCVALCYVCVAVCINILGRIFTTVVSVMFPRAQELRFNWRRRQTVVLEPEAEKNLVQASEGKIREEEDHPSSLPLICGGNSEHWSLIQIGLASRRAQSEARAHYVIERLNGKPTWWDRLEISSHAWPVDKGRMYVKR